MKIREFFVCTPQHNQLSSEPSELLGGEGRLGNKSRPPAGARDHPAILRRKLLQPRQLPRTLDASFDSTTRIDRSR
jgi:hypothetical protein